MYYHKYLFNLIKNFNFLITTHSLIRFQLLIAASFPKDNLDIILGFLKTFLLLLFVNHIITRKKVCIFMTTLLPFVKFRY